MKTKTLLAIVVAIANTFVFAHSGGTNSGGCHTDSRTGHYHCH